MYIATKVLLTGEVEREWTADRVNSGAIETRDIGFGSKEGQIGTK